MSMYVCDTKHEEIVYKVEGYINTDCPICQLVEEKDSEISDRDNTIEELESEISTLESDISERDDRISELEAEL